MLRKKLAIKLNYLISMLIASGLIYQCANPLSPTGGPNDETDPQLDIENSTPNLQTNLKPEKIELKFDEWIVVKNPSTEIIVSPPLKFKPKVKTKGKGVILIFDDQEVLRDSTTYVINFGESIQDLTAGNAFKDYTFVFSTGNQLDKQKISGKITDAFTGEPAKGAIVVLYDKIQDSIIFQEKPVYYTSVKENGTFIIDYLREDTFLIFALVDINRNYYHDQENESFGYYGQPILTKDTFNNEIRFPIYLPTITPRIIENDDDQKGKLKLITLGDGNKLDITITPKPKHIIKRITEDSIVYFFTPIDSSFNFYAHYESKNDTIKYRPVKNQKETRLSLESPLLTKVIEIDPLKTTNLIFNMPLKAYDLSKWQVIDTMAEIHKLDLISLDDEGFKWQLKINDKRNEPQKLEIYPGGLIDFYSRKNQDTITLKYKILTTEDVSLLNIAITALDSSLQYIAYVKKGNEKIKTLTIQNKSIYTRSIKNLIPGIYNLEIIEDINKNNRWDGGNYMLRTSPEKVMRVTVEPLRANWDVEVDIEWR